MWKNLVRAWLAALSQRHTARVTVEIRESGGGEVIERIFATPGSIATVYLESFDGQRKWGTR